MHRLKLAATLSDGRALRQTFSQVSVLVYFLYKATIYGTFGNICLHLGVFLLGAAAAAKGVLPHIAHAAQTVAWELHRQ